MMSDGIDRTRLPAGEPPRSDCDASPASAASAGPSDTGITDPRCTGIISQSPCRTRYPGSPMATGGTAAQPELP